jgi:hypothetical protein
MIDKNTICTAIREIYPDIGECGIDLTVDFDKQNDAWAVELKKEGRVLKTYLETADSDTCITKENCIGLGVEIAQLKGNIDRMPA